MVSASSEAPSEEGKQKKKKVKKKDSISSMDSEATSEDGEPPFRSASADPVPQAKPKRERKSSLLSSSSLIFAETVLTALASDSPDSPTKATRPRRLSKSLSNDFVEEPKEMGTVRTIFNRDGTASTLYKTLQVSSRDKTQDVMKLVLKKHDVDTAELKYFNMLVHANDSTNQRVLISSDVPLHLKKELTVGDTEPVFEIRDVRVVSHAVVPEEAPKRRARSSTFSTFVKRMTMDLDAFPELPSDLATPKAEKTPDKADKGAKAEKGDKSKEKEKGEKSKKGDKSEKGDKSDKSDKEEKRGHARSGSASSSHNLSPEILMSSPVPITDESGSIRVQYQGNYKTMLVTGESTSTSVLKEAFEKFQIFPGLTFDSFHLVALSKEGKERRLETDEKILSQAAPALMYEVREAVAEVIPDLKEETEHRSRPLSFASGFSSPFRKRAGSDEDHTKKTWFPFSGHSPQKDPTPNPSPGVSPEKPEEAPQRRLRGFTISSGRGKITSELGKDLQKNVFGVDLSTQVSVDGADIPHVVTECVAQVEARGMELEGIYRLSGMTSRVRVLKQQYSLGLRPDLAAELEVPNVTSLLKDYFRELPTSLISPPVIVSLIAALAAPEESRLALAKDALATLPPVHLRTLRFLLDHLLRVAGKSEVNKMDVGNLSVVFGPTLMINPDSTDAFEDMKNQTGVIMFIFVHESHLF